MGRHPRAAPTQQYPTDDRVNRKLVRMIELDFDDDGFRRNGAPHRIVSGALHYFRVHPELWDDRLARLRALGANTVDTYIPWNFHELPSGEIDFTGWRDISRFVRTAERHGLDVILRPGPYICAEWESGGLPARLLAAEGMGLRSSDPAFLAEVDGWFDAVVPELLPLLGSRGGPVVAVQVENEYGSYGNDAAYLAHLRDGLVARGVDCLLFTADGSEDFMQQGGAIPGLLATGTFGSRAPERFEVLRRQQPKGRWRRWSSGSAGSTESASRTTSGTPGRRRPRSTSCSRPGPRSTSTWRTAAPTSASGRVPTTRGPGPTRPATSRP